MRYVFYIIVALFAGTVFANIVSAQNLTPEQILSKHLAAIGSPAKLQSLKTLFAAGRSEFESRMPIVRGGGKAVVISDPENLYFLMSLNSKEYPFEKIGMFRDKVSLPFITSGNRSTLGSFLSEHPRVLSDSLFCGSMSLRWITNVASNTKLKLSSAGKKKINDRQTYVIEVLMGASTGEFKVRLFFDAEKFYHVRTEYRRVVPAKQATFGRQNEIADATVEVTEEFSDFKDVDGLMLPYDYKVTLVSNSGSQSFSNSWGIKVVNYYLNQKLADDFFTFDVK
jgi:hypothetical protein